MNIVLAIATLCQIATGNKYTAPEIIETRQKQCQIKLAECMLDKMRSFKYNAEKDLLKCIKKRK